VAAAGNQAAAATAGDQAVTYVSSSNAGVATAAAGPIQPPITNIVATTPEQDRQAAIEKDMDTLKEALLDGGSDPKLVDAVREKLLHPDSEVRKTAVQTVMYLDDRASIPTLQQALAQVEDPREKVSIMDAIEYLQTPEGDPQLIADTPPPGPPPSITNRPTIPQLPVRQPRAGKN